MTPGLDELLEPYRADRSPERFVCLIDDLEAMRVVAVWGFLPKTWKAPRRPMPDEPNARWGWIWNGVSFDDEALAEMADLPVHRMNAKVTMLASARILFPDGTVPAGALGILHGAVVGRIKLEPKKKAK